MSVTVSKWGNSLGIRLPAHIVELLSIKNGDSIEYEIKDNTVVLRKEKSTEQLFEEFYGKPFSEITAEDIGSTQLLDFGEDVGGEIF